MIYTQSPKILAYHGTYPENIDGIKENNFFETENHDVWLGDGVYFFIDGIGSLAPQVYAQQFAIDQCWNKITRTYQKKEYCVLEAAIKINENKYLNLTEAKGSRLFNQFRDKIIESLAKSGKAIAGKEYNDTDVLKIMREALGIEFVKSNVYIKFAIQRIRRFESKIPNVTVLVVNNPSKNVQKASIKQIKKGEII